jgi:hypothetical protein
MKRHPLDVVSLLAGLLFTGLGIAFLLDALNAWSADITWVPPIVLIVFGLAGVLSTIGRHRGLPAPGTTEPETAEVDAL